MSKRPEYDLDGTCAVVVVAYNDGERIERVVERLLEFSPISQVVVVDNGDGRSADAAQSAGATVLRRPDNPGFGASQNVGVAATDARVVLLLNPDATIRESAVIGGLAWLNGHLAVAAVQGVIRSSRTGEVERSAGDELRPLHLVGRLLRLRRLLATRVGKRLAHILDVSDHLDRTPEEPRSVEALAATALLVRRRAFDEIGGFDERFFLYGEDLDLSRRLREQGWELVTLPDEWSDHVSGGSFTGTWDRELQWWRGTLTFGALWWTDVQWHVARILALARWAALVIRRPGSVGYASRALLSEPRAVRSRRARLR